MEIRLYGHIDNSAVEENGASTSLSTLTRKGALSSSITVNGWIRNLEELKLLLADKGMHILAINETTLNNNIESEIMSVDGYTLRRMSVTDMEVISIHVYQRRY